ncbi:hypothetical protein ACOSQ2_021827 [Xanthoceras sorbifolium]
MLQVLVSIQALILNQKPYFNEPGYASWNGTAKGETNSQKYNENTFILSVKTMVYTIKRPPKLPFHIGQEINLQSQPSEHLFHCLQELKAWKPFIEPISAALIQRECSLDFVG